MLKILGCVLMFNSPRYDTYDTSDPFSYINYFRKKYHKKKVYGFPAISVICVMFAMNYKKTIFGGLKNEEFGS